MEDRGKEHHSIDDQLKAIGDEIEGLRGRQPDFAPGSPESEAYIRKIEDLCFRREALYRRAQELDEADRELWQRLRNDIAHIWDEVKKTITLSKEIPR